MFARLSLTFRFDRTTRHRISFFSIIHCFHIMKTIMQQKLIVANAKLPNNQNYPMTILHNLNKVLISDSCDHSSLICSHHPPLCTHKNPLRQSLKLNNFIANKLPILSKSFHLYSSVWSSSRHYAMLPLSQMILFSLPTVLIGVSGRIIFPFFVYFPHFLTVLYFLWHL